MASKGRVVVVGVGVDGNGDGDNTMPTSAEMELAIQRLIGVSVVGEAVPGGTLFPWVISNKYYTAAVDVVLVGGGEREPQAVGAAASVPSPASQHPAVAMLTDASAVVVLSRQFTPATIEMLTLEWAPTLAAINPEIRLLLEVPTIVSENGAGGGGAVASAATDRDAGDDGSVLQWALEHQFEYVDPVDDEEEDGGSAGFSRAAEALQSHMWPGMVMKEKVQPTAHRSAEDTEIGGADVDGSAPGQGNGKVSTQVHTDEGVGAGVPGSEVDGLLSGFNLDGLLSSMDVLTRDVDGVNDDEVEGSDEAFMMMLEQMKVMKDQAKALPDAQRKEYAEKVAMKFYESLCADEEEGHDSD